MAFTLTELFSIGGGNITLATGLGGATDEVYVGVGNKIYKRNVGESNFNQFYVSNRARVIPFFLNGSICVCEYSFGSSAGSDTNLFLFRKNLTQSSTNSIGFGDVIGRIYAIKIKGILTTANGKAVIAVETRESENGFNYLTNRLYETDGTLQFDLSPLNTPDRQNASANDFNPLQYRGLSIKDGKFHITSYYFLQSDDELLHFTYDGVAYESFYRGNNRPLNREIFGAHNVSGENRVFQLSSSGLYLYSYDTNEALTPLIENNPAVTTDDFVTGNDNKIVNITQDDEFVYVLLRDYLFSTNQGATLFRYSKIDFTVEKNSYAESIELMQFNSAFEGIGIGDTFFSFQVPETPPEPTIQAPRLIYPKSNPIRFVRLQSYNATSNPKNINNTLYCDLKHNNITKAFFAQPYLKSDVPQIQFLSNVDTQSISLELLDIRDNFIKDLDVQKLVDVIGQVLQYSVTITIDSINGNPVILFGGTGKIPSGLEPESGNSILIENSGDPNLDGLYFITNVFFGAGADPDKIFFNYQGVINGSPTADVKFFEGAGTNNVYAGIIDAQDQPNGYYKLRLTISGEGQSIINNSELLLIQDQFDEDETVLIEYQNNDKFFRIDYGVSPAMKLRVFGRFFYQKPNSDKTLMQDSDFDDIIIRATPSNTITLNIFLVPFYLHRILNLCFSHDIITVQGIKVTAGGEYKIESLSDLYSLSNGAIDVKEKDYADEYNEIDSGITGDVDETGAIGSNDGVLGY